MREIKMENSRYKFRAWDDFKKKMIYEFSEYDCHADYGDLVISNQDDIRSDYYETTLMQYTGLLDKNGKEIYESDIVSPKNNSGNWIGVVQWNRGAFWIYEVAGELSREESQWSIDIDCEIIGNIHENPELI